jgi:hypothetical protein
MGEDDWPASLDDLIDLLAQHRGCSRAEARQALATMPGGQELLLGLVPPDQSELVLETAAG